MPLQATSGAASYDAFGGGVPVVPNYIEEVFSTYLYTGNGTTNNIVNGIDLSTKGGLVWFKSRSYANEHALFDTARGNASLLCSNITNAANPYGTPNVLTSFNSNGFSLGQDNYGWVNSDTFSQVSWTFREQPKFFDVVTYTGNDAASRNIAHNLGSTPGCIIIKNTSYSGAQAWVVWHRTQNDKYLQLWKTDAVATDGGSFYPSLPTSTNFTIGPAGAVNDSSSNYVAYLFAHDAGGFGLTGTDNVISCGSFTSSAIGTATVNLGYEPQWLLYKGSNGVTNWSIVDNMRGFVAGAANANTKYLNANSSAAELDTAPVGITSTGFTYDSAANITFIYIAIRRGPMKVPTVGTSVFYPTTYTGTGSARTFSGFGFPPDMELSLTRGSGDGNGPEIYDKLRGPRVRILTAQSDAEFTTTESVTMLQDGISVGATTHSYINFNGYTKVLYAFKRAPSFFDEVCYSGTGSNTTQTHNLGVAPELMILKQRSGGGQDWPVYASPLGASNVLILNSTAASTSLGTVFNSTAPTSTVFSLGTNNSSNSSGINYVIYLFATTAGVSKVGSFTGNGSSQTINCGFTGGARFVLIKKTSGTGDWMVSDSARGIVSGSDPYLELNNTNAEVTGEDWLDTDSTGFVVNEVSGSNANTNGATYIFLAIA
jgi:hypothetical protein